jgi:hypothetical protein
MTELGTASRTRGRRLSGAAPRRGSAGLPGNEMLTAEERIAELEARLATLEGSVSIRERGRDMMDKIMPPEAGRHFRNPGREQLLGMRSILDFWIRRIESAEQRASAADASRETIPID